MKQGVLPFQYEQEKSPKGMTALSGLVTYLELMHAAGLRSSVERHVALRECGQGWTDSQVVSSLILLNLAGGESVVDLDVLEKDAGFCRVLREVETYGMHRRERRALEVSRVNHICQFSINQFCRFTSSAWPRCWAASVR